MSKYTYHARFTLVDEFKVSKTEYKYYDVDFLEIEDLKISYLSLDMALQDAKRELLEYLYSKIKNGDKIPNLITGDDVVLNSNQFIKKIEIDTDAITEVYKNDLIHKKIFSDISCFATAEGICKRVLKDIKKEYDGLSIDALKLCYEYDKNHFINQYRNIIELGELLKSLQEY